MRSLVVGGVQIPEALIAREAQNHPASDGAQAWAEAAHALAVRALLLHRARQLDLEPEPEIDAAGREETPEEALIRAVLDLEVTVEAPTEAECRRVYESQAERFRTPDLVEASHILLAAEGDDGRQAALDVIADLACAPGRFAELARTLSACSSAAVGGSLGQLGPGDLVGEVEAVLARLQPGQVSPEPVRSRFGWHVLRLDRRIEGRALPFEHVEPNIRLNLEGRAWSNAAARYVSALADQARHDGVIQATDGDADEGGATLGALLVADVTAGRLAAWLGGADPALLARVEAAAGQAETPLAAWVRAQARAFVADADDEAWTQLISAAQGATDPALAALASILRGKLTPEPRRFTVIQRRA